MLYDEETDENLNTQTQNSNTINLTNEKSVENKEQTVNDDIVVEEEVSSPRKSSYGEFKNEFSKGLNEENLPRKESAQNTKLSKNMSEVKEPFENNLPSFHKVEEDKQKEEDNYFSQENEEEKPKNASNITNFSKDDSVKEVFQNAEQGNETFKSNASYQLNKNEIGVFQEEDKKQIKKKVNIIKITNNKIKEEKNENIKNEGFLKSAVSLLIEFLITFCLSLYPGWCDEFENKNPVINNDALIQPENANNNNEINNEEELKNMEEKIKEDIDKNLLKELNTKEDEDSKEKKLEAANKVSINTDIDENVLSENNEKNNPKEGKYERVILKSSNDTRNVNHDEQSKTFNIFPDDIKTENEFIFSENAYIDNISYNNESLFEAHKRREMEKEKEKEKENISN